MRVRILGAAAGGGFPQWNSCAPACRRAGSGDAAALPRTQTSAAVSADGHHWFLLNASPDVLYLEAGDGDAGIVMGEDTVGARIWDAHSQLYFIPSCAAMVPEVEHRLRGAELVLFDGTLWRDDEMIHAGVGRKTGRRMGHMSLSGPNGTIAAFATLDVRRKILLHINNSNPVLLDGTPERAELEAAGWEVAWDGMELGQ